MAARKKAMKPAQKNKAKPKETSKGAHKTTLKVPKLTVPKEPFKQSDFFNVLADQSHLSQKEVKGVLEAIKAIAKVHLVKNGPGQFTVPGLCKLRVVTKPATKARKGRNPFTGEEIMLKAKPARKVIKIKLVKKFKTALE